MLQFEHEGQPPQALRWRTTKTEELFAYLLQHRTEIVYREKIIDMLWPEADYKKATAHLYTLIYQLRKTLKQSNIDVRICKISGKEGYVLEPQNVRIDTDVWEMGIRELGSVEQHNYAEHHSLIDQYSGDYLGVYDYIWAESERQRLRTIWLHHAMQVAKFYTRNNMLAEAVTVYQRIVQLQPYSEEGNLGLMKIYDRMGQPSLVVMQFRTLQQMLKEELGIGLSENVRSWYEIWVAGNK
jgi:two-component SAPR family response regulator